MINFFVKRPITTLMFVLFWVVLGVVSYPKMKIERTPSIEFPYVTSTFVYPGASPEEIESQVIKKAEDVISETSGIKNITSQIFENGGFILSEFKLGVDVNEKASEIKAKLDSISSEFPTDLKKPIVEKVNPLQQSVIDIVIDGKNQRDLEEYIKDDLSNKITAIDGIANVNIFGGKKRAVRIYVNPELMTSKGVGIMDVVSALGTKNLNVPGGKIELGTSSSNVRFIGEFQSIDDIKHLRIVNTEGQNFTLDEIAEVKDDIRDIETGARYNSKDVIILSIIKASDGNAVKISKALRKKISSFEEILKSKFPDASMKIIADSSISISNDTRGTINGIILGVIFTVIVLLFFTRNKQSTIIAGVVIPVSLISGFFFMNNNGFTINSMTLLAYSSALGTLVSNAIILIESALQELNKGKNSIDASIDGTKKVIVPILAGVGTNIVVFLPLAFMGGIAGQFMLQFGLTVVYLTILSLMFSFSLTPMMIALLLKPNKNKKIKEKADKKESFKALKYQYDNPKKTIIFWVICLVLSFGLLGFVGNEFSPSIDNNQISINVRTPQGSTFEKSEKVVKIIEEKLSNFKEVKATSVKIGERGVQNISIKVELEDRSKRSISDKRLVQKILPSLSSIPDVEIRAKAGEGMQGGAISSDLVLNVFGDNNEKREKYAKEILDIINSISEIQSSVFAAQEANNEIKFISDDKKMSFWGVKNSYAGMTLRTAIFGNDSYKYKEGGKEYPIIFEFSKPFISYNMFDDVYVNSYKGLVALSSLGEIKIEKATPNIYRLNKSRITEIDINLGKSTIGPVQKKIERRLSKIKFEEGYGYKFAGMSEIQSETNSEMGTAFLLATVLTFMLLAAIMNSLLHPFTIASSIITSFIGVFAMLFLSGSSINIAALLAVVMLVGLVVNNNIIVLEPTIQRIRNGEDTYSALSNEFKDKKNMILMTSIAIIAGMLPQLFNPDGSKQSMAAVMIGGMIASLSLTFFLTPAIFFAFERIKNKSKR